MGEIILILFTIGIIIGIKGISSSNKRQATMIKNKGLQKDIVSSNDINIREIEVGTNIEEIKKYKKLLDTGIITEEEFETKKKELLNL